MNRSVVLRGGLCAALLALALAAPGSAAFAQVPLAIARADASAAVNAFRDAARLSRLGNDPVLTALATQQALAMAASGTMSHTIAGTLQARLAAGGYGGRAAAENIGYGQATLDAVLGSWMQSAPHRANILDQRMTAFGVGAATVNGTTYWALILAAPR
ncbi:MAG: CAP domain-containing protein [Bauldia sp.]|nr:CAP domain-containing protein [Bauldia sp.]